MIERMKKFLAFLLCAATACGFAGCSDDEEEGILTSPEALVGKWQLVRSIEHYCEDGRWYDDVEYDVDELNGGDLFFEIYETDGTYRYENYRLDGTLWRSGTYGWRYENGRIYHGDFDPYVVVVLTASKLVVRDYDNDEEYDEDTYRRIE